MVRRYHILGITFSVLTMIAWATFIAGCGGGESNSTGVPDPSPTPTPTPSPPSDPGSAPPDTVNNLGFYVKVIDDGKFLNYMTKNSTFNTSCLVSPTDPTNTDLNCIADIQEGDLFYHPLKLNYNVSPNMCTYLRITPYYYYNFESGTGPSAITLNIFATNGTSTVTGCSVTGSQGTNAACTGNSEVTINTSNQKYSCIYDRSGSDQPNCCFGNYTFTKVITGEGAGTDVQNLNWGGSIKDCLGGPGIHSWTHHSKAGWPQSELNFTDKTGLNETWTIESPIKRVLTTNFSVANYHGGNVNHGHDAFYIAGTSNLPYAIEPMDDRDGTSMTTTNASYKFECLDQAHEVKHRIQLYVREWDTYANFVTYGTTNGVSGSPDIAGSEDGVACNYGFGSGFPCDDRYDVDDLLNLQDSDLSVTTDTYKTIVGSESLRYNYFPAEQ
ncbi:MAG: hypothetical protein AB7F86_16615 [Bdellovibrionales bacterium]